MKNIEDLPALLAAAIKAYGESSPRSVQSADGVLGASDMGFCQQKAVLMTRGVEQSDSVPIAAAQIGTAIHAYLEEATAFLFPNWVIEDHKITATLPSKATVSGTPDVIATEYNTVLDWKTVDGFEWVKREGTSRNHQWQRHIYALGAMQEGLLDGTKPVYVMNGYIDRSGKEPEPYFTWQEFDWTIINEIDSWISDVQYAVMNREDASRDIPAPVCERICSYYTVCRGNLPVEDGGEVIEDPERLAALRMYVESRDLEKQAGKAKREAQSVLLGTNGIGYIDGAAFQVRWTHINETEVAGFTRAASDRMDVRAVKTPRVSG